MNNTETGVNPSGYMGSGYGLSVNRALMSTPQHPIAVAPAGTLVQGAPINPGDVAVAPAGGSAPVLPGGIEINPTLQQGGWRQIWGLIGHPIWHSGYSNVPLGILGFHFNQSTGRVNG